MEGRESGANLVGPYRLSYTLGEGTTGKVKLAEHIETHEKVAVKIISKEAFLTRDNLETKVQREIALMRLVHHPNILRFVEIFESKRHLYIVIEYAERGELFDFLVRNKTLPEPLALEFFRQIVLALEYLHQLGICHRDLKPENILLDQADRIKIADFGFARWVKSNVTETSCGSPHYAAPEVVRGLPYDGRIADIWSMGVILFALLAGYLPFDDPKIRVLLSKVKRGVFEMPAEFSDDCKDLIWGMIQVDTTKRMTMDQIKSHKCFTSVFAPLYIMPSPIPYPDLLGQIHLSSLPESIVSILQRIGFDDLEELETELMKETNSMAKVFVSMLTLSDDLKLLPWGESNRPRPTDLEPNSFMIGRNRQTSYGMDHYINRSDRVLAESLGMQSSFVKTMDWPLEFQPTTDGIQSNTLFVQNMTTWDIMNLTQEIANSLGLQWFHPDPQTIISRFEPSQTYISIRTMFTGDRDMNIVLTLHEGDPELFGEFCSIIGREVA